jgi:hypothetical protein
MNDRREIERRFREVIAGYVHAPLKTAGYRRSGRVWRLEGGELVRSADVQRSSDRDRLSFTLNVGIVVPALLAYEWGGGDEGQLDPAFGVLRCRVGAFLPDPGYDLWFHVTASGLSAGSIYEPTRPFEGTELSGVLRDRVIPTLDSYRSIGDVLDVEAADLGWIDREPEPPPPPLPTDPFMREAVEAAWQGVEMRRRRKTISGLQAAIAWLTAGSPLVAVRVDAMGGGDGVTVEVDPDLRQERPDLVPGFVHHATPFLDAYKVHRVDDTDSARIRIYGRALNAPGLQRLYSRFLSVRRFDPQILEPPFERLGVRYDPSMVSLAEVDVEAGDEPGTTIVSFDVEVASEHNDLVALCVERCRAFPGVESAVHEDRELIIVWGHPDRRKLRAHLLRFVRSRLKQRAQSDCEADG